MLQSPPFNPSPIRLTTDICLGKIALNLAYEKTKGICWARYWR